MLAEQKIVRLQECHPLFFPGGGTVAVFFCVSLEKFTVWQSSREGNRMTLRETYNKMGGDYNDVIGRFYSEALIDRFLRKFPEDPSFQELEKAFAAGETRDAFCAAHTLKGICQSLAIANLLVPLKPMTELLRSNKFAEAQLLQDEVEKQYWITMSAIREYIADHQ